MMIFSAPDVGLFLLNVLVVELKVSELLRHVLADPRNDYHWN
jgi:hypothetical protein